MSVRRVVSGQNDRGRSVIVRDELIEPAISPIAAVAQLWGADETQSLPLDGTPAAYEDLFPGPGGYRFMILTLPPHSVAAPTAEEMANFAPDVREKMADHEPGMHATDTVDLEVVISGEATLELDDGAMLHLKAGDSFIQNGTRHRWSNRGDVPAVVSVVLIGCHPR